MSANDVAAPPSTPDVAVNPEEGRGRCGYRPTGLQEQLLLVALGDPDSAAEAWKSLPASFSLDDLEPGSFELLPLVYRNVAQTDPADPLLPRLKGIYRRSWVKNNLLLGRTSEIGTYEWPGAPSS